MQEQPKINQENVNRYACQNCGSNMVFDPRIGKLACPYCSHSQQIETTGGVIEERSYEEFLQRGAQQLQPLAREAMQVSCTTCGATVVFTPPETARSCDFCGAKIVAQPKAADPLVAPEGVLPFSITSQQAAAAFQTWIGSLWFAPSQLKSMARAEKASSVYIPYWTYDSDTQTDYSGERGDHYYETEYYTETDSEGRSEQKSRQVQRTNWYHAAGRVARHFDDVAVPATKSVLPKYLEKLNWNFAELVPYEPAYLSGHKAQTYQVALDEGFERFKQLIEGTIQSDIRSDIGGDEQRIHNAQTGYYNITFKHLLLPVYANAYRFNNKTFQIVINGRTGEVQGERPYSWLKIGCLILAISAVVLCLIALLLIVKGS